MEPTRNPPPTSFRPINSNTTPNPTPNGAPHQVPTNGTRVSHQTTMKNSTKSGAEGPTQNRPPSEMLRPTINLTGPIIVPNFEITGSPAICEKWTSSRKVADNYYAGITEKKPENKIENKTEKKVEKKTQGKIENKTENKTESKAETKTENKTEIKIEKLKTVCIMEMPIESTIVIHDVKHYGEAAHTIRHWLRGGQVCVPGGGTLKWHNCLEALFAASPNRRTEWEIVFAEPRGYVCRPHTDVHHSQTSDTAATFTKQLIAEMSLPQLIKMTDGYKDVESEVKRQLTALTDRKEMKGVKSFDLIVWHRDVPGNNRKVDSDEHDACLEGALAALGKLKNKNLSKDTCVLHLGDKDKSPDKPPKKYLCSMLDQHVKGEKGDRTMLQQLQFICAVVDLSKAQLIVSERTGLADLLALAGGIPECQFVGRHEREGNDRLDEVYESGCGMGMNVKFGIGVGKENELLMMNACTKAIADRKQLVIEMETIMKQT